MTVYTLNPVKINDDRDTWPICKALDIPAIKGFPYSLIYDTLWDGDPDEKGDAITAWIEVHTPFIARDMDIFLLRLTFDTNTNVVGAVYRIDDHVSTCTWTIDQEHSQKLQDYISKQTSKNIWAVKQ